jgi:hypothetical protein
MIGLSWASFRTLFTFPFFHFSPSVPKLFVSSIVIWNGSELLFWSERVTWALILDQEHTRELPKAMCAYRFWGKGSLRKLFTPTQGSSMLLKLTYRLFWSEWIQWLGWSTRMTLPYSQVPHCGLPVAMIMSTIADPALQGSPMSSFLWTTSWYDFHSQLCLLLS